MVSVTIWNEYRHEREDGPAKDVYPDGIHHALADALSAYGHTVRTATLDDPEHGLTEAVLDETEVLVWWGHLHHDEVADDVVGRIKRRVLDGMGFVPLHSSHESKPFAALMGTSGTLRWRETGEKERVWVVEPSHPVVDGIDESVEIPEAEMYGERFDVPAPDTLVTISWFEGGEVFRSGCCYRRGNGKIFYFRPGHETFPVYHQPEVRRILHNAVEWAQPADTPPSRTETEHVTDPLEPLE
ncbi:ThuA domain-containing protein [Natrinema ejinorense]|uniref:Trehalose utilization protein ThuA n=1 Tax=Natrinema ejinorense TaxID=373386 RepID=A0A2A5QPT8_9EURY|nr:ThuA domain-containing protein [Natrinema ejinorense]PCR88832.1 trehalose utilization protein ThuA [Natrinema ejinorense]